MKLALSLALAVALAISASSATPDVGQGEGEVALSRQRRRVDQMREMLRSKTGRSPSDFIGYGNFCGRGGSGTPVDAIDACCQTHDMCYRQLNRDNRAGICTSDNSPKFRPYWSQYNYTSIDGVIECRDNNVTSRYRRCLRRLCECDKVLAHCLQDKLASYNDDRLKTYLAPVRLAFRLSDKLSNQNWFWILVKKYLDEE